MSQLHLSLLPPPTPTPITSYPKSPLPLLSGGNGGQKLSTSGISNSSSSSASSGGGSFTCSVADGGRALSAVEGDTSSCSIRREELDVVWRRGGRSWSAGLLPGPAGGRTGGAAEADTAGERNVEETMVCNCGRIAAAVVKIRGACSLVGTLRGGDFALADLGLEDTVFAEILAGGGGPCLSCRCPEEDIFDVALAADVPRLIAALTAVSSMVFPFRLFSSTMRSPICLPRPISPRLLLPLLPPLPLLERFARSLPSMTLALGGG